MKILGIYSVLCLMIICVVEVCDAECDKYVLVLEETTCSKTGVGTIYKIKPQNKKDIHWNNVEYPCNSTEEGNPKKEDCLVEFNCVGTELNCQDHIKKVNKQIHYFIADNQTGKRSTIRTEAPDVTTSKITVTETPHLTLDEEFKASTYDVSLIFINENDIKNRSETITKTPRNETLYCDYAEVVCLDEKEPENNTSNEFNDATFNTHHKELTRSLQITIDRDENSSVQPIFTGYFPESSSDSSTNYNGNFKSLKTMSTPCSIPKHNNCKEKMKINVYWKANYIENNTISKYPKCTKKSNSSENVLNVKCEDISFEKHNRHIVQTLPTPPTPSPTKKEMWNCQLKYTILSSKLSENNTLHFINCSKETNIVDNSIKSADSHITPNPNSKNTTIPSILIKYDTEMKKTESSTGEEKRNTDNSSYRHPENMMIILVTENTNNCSINTSLNVDEGKIIDLGVNNKEKIVQNNNVELILSNCMNSNSSIINNEEPPSNAELTIILKNESLNASNLEQFNGTSEDKNVKQRILLRCDHLSNESSSNATSSKTTLQCESIDLNFYNITGIEITENTSETTNRNINKDLTKENGIMVETIGSHKVGIHKNGKLSTNETTENKGTVNNTSHEDSTKIPFKNKEVLKNISEAIASKKKYKNIGVQNLEVTFNRRKDIPNSARPNSLSLGSPERENIFLIGLLSMIGVAILMAIMWRVWPKRREYDAAPTREPADEEETAF